MSLSHIIMSPTVRMIGIFSIGSIVIGISSGQDLAAKARALEYK
jgi:hypothetical protein